MTEETLNQGGVLLTSICKHIDQFLYWSVDMYFITIVAFYVNTVCSSSTSNYSSTYSKNNCNHTEVTMVAVPQWNHSESYYTVQQRNHYNCFWSWWYSGKLSQMSDQGQLTLRLQLVFSTYINQVKNPCFSSCFVVKLTNIFLRCCECISFFGVVSVVVWGYSYNLYWVSASTVRFDYLWYLKKHSKPRRWSIHICL